MKVCLGAARSIFVAELADEDVDGAVAVPLPAAPDPLHQLLARDDAALLERERVEQAELGGRQIGAHSVDVSLDIRRVDRQLLDLDRLAAVG